MPYPLPGSLTADDTYAVTAYILNLNGLLPEDGKLDRDNLPKIRMPNRDGFIPDAVFKIDSVCRMDPSYTVNSSASSNASPPGSTAARTAATSSRLGWTFLSRRPWPSEPLLDVGADHPPNDLRGSEILLGA
jgi:hypothetical protein